ncbi:sensor histidine kinase [Rossellomorea vietnamensis]|uniref:Sensor histidine kinase n=1 Tax=Rossellomorea vietnamensis TaxID=218284 RepID=A0ACD4C3V4_9BACI|nr:sensor histidine kinase [Rossellomorea vietnamensis]UXH43295.1 sensor histidine kinase [Rossellomorea vietnamensis]
MEHHTVEHLCEIHTNLSVEEIEKIKEVAVNLPLMADLNKAHIFVDCLTKEGTQAIVVAEAAPSTSKAIYKNAVAGKIVYEPFEPSVLYTLRSGQHVFHNRAITQEGKTVEQSVVPIKGENESVIGTLIMEKDISEQLQRQQKLDALSEATEALSEILIGASEGHPIIPEVIEESLFFIEDDSKILYSNSAAASMIQNLGMGECLPGDYLAHYFPEMKEILKCPEELLVKEIKFYQHVFKVKKIQLGNPDKPNGTFIIFKNITELREKERELIVKSVAIREIHHRVKNNLQTVASLLRLQMRRGLPEESKVYFVESLNRISSIASVYEIILATSSVDEVDLYRLIEKIGNMLVSEAEGHKSINITYSGPQLLIQSNKAVSVALVLNELIQNCMKHAFKQKVEGEIQVVFMRVEDHLEVRVIDNGEGLSTVYKPSLGLDIVKMMIEHDLSGDFSIEPAQNAGTVALVTFPLEKEEALV